MKAQSIIYSPKWIYRFFNWIYRTPGKGWLLAIVWNVGLAYLYHWRAWQLGFLPQGEIHVFLLATGYWSTFYIFMLMSLDQRAESSLQEFGESNGKSSEEIDSLTNDFISLPGKTFLISILIALPAILPVSIESYPRVFPGVFEIFPVLTVVLTLLFNTSLMVYFLVRTFRQLRMVQQLYREMPEVSLFQLEPIFALSRYTGSVSLLWLSFALVAPSIAAPELLVNNVPLFAVFIVFGLLIFFLPLREIQVRLSHAKRDYLAKLSHQLETAFTKTQREVESGSGRKLPNLRLASESIRDQLEFVRTMPTLPWKPGTLRTALAPILIPIIVGIVQTIIVNVFEL